MHENVIRSYLWEDVIRAAFCPSSTKEQQSWLIQYGKSLKDFWESESYPPNPKIVGGKIAATIDCVRSVDLCLEYSVTSPDKFVINFMYRPPQNTKELMWTHDVDKTYFSFSSQTFLTDHGRRKEVIRDFSDEDIKAVLDSLLHHPTAHQHIESPIDNHEIRIGGGIQNLFLYLFHLRYQLCPISLKRDAEERRLFELFKAAIKANASISACDLMAQPVIR